MTQTSDQEQVRKIDGREALSHEAKRQRLIAEIQNKIHQDWLAQVAQGNELKHDGKFLGITPADARRVAQELILLEAADIQKSLKDRHCVRGECVASILDLKHQIDVLDGGVVNQVAKPEVTIDSKQAIIDVLVGVPAAEPEDADTWTDTELKKLPATLVPADEPQEMVTLAWHILEEWAKDKPNLLDSEKLKENTQTFGEAKYLAEQIIKKYAETDTSAATEVLEFTTEQRSHADKINSLEESVAQCLGQIDSVVRKYGNSFPTELSDNVANMVFREQEPIGIFDLAKAGTDAFAEASVLIDHISSLSAEIKSERGALTQFSEKIATQPSGDSAEADAHSVADLINARHQKEKARLLREIADGLRKPSADTRQTIFDNLDTMQTLLTQKAKANSEKLEGVKANAENKYRALSTQISAIHAARLEMDGFIAQALAQKNLLTQTDGATDALSTTERMLRLIEAKNSIRKILEQYDTTLANLKANIALLPKPLAKKLLAQLPRHEAALEVSKARQLLKTMDREIKNLKKKSPSENEDEETESKPKKQNFSAFKGWLLVEAKKAIKKLSEEKSKNTSRKANEEEEKDANKEHMNKIMRVIYDTWHTENERQEKKEIVKKLVKQGVNYDVILETITEMAGEKIAKGSGVN